MGDADANGAPQDIDMMIDISTVSAIHKCSSRDAKHLLLHDLGHYKLKIKSTFDIGGTYTDSEPDLWFYLTTNVCTGHNTLINLFVCHRKVGCFRISISNSKELHLVKGEGTLTSAWALSGEYSLPNTLVTNLYKSSKPDQNHYITTYCFSSKDIKNLEKNSLLIPIRIEMNPKDPFNMDIVKQIKLDHDFKDLLSKQDTTDFVLKSSSGRSFQVHKIILAAHSPVMLNIIKNAKSPSANVDISDNHMELFLQFIYTGAIDNMLKQECLKLLEIASKFQVQSLFTLTQCILSEQINIKNAVDIAGLSVKYKLEKLQATVFQFIKNNRQVLETDQWKNLNDVELAKQLAHYMSLP